MALVLPLYCRFSHCDKNLLLAELIVISGKPLAYPFLFFGTCYLVILILITLSQRSLLYQASHAKEEFLLAKAPSLHFQPWLNREGQRIGWIRTGSGPGLPLLIMHGNAGYALHRSILADCFGLAANPCAIAILEYPGYGSRAGSPNRKSMVEAGVQAIDLLHEQTKRPVVLIGESIGSVVAGESASQRPEFVGGLMMLTPMNKLVDVAQSHFWFLPVSLILFDRYDNEKALAHLKVPLAVVLAGNDEVVPRRFGEKLFNAYSGTKKKWTVPEATHNGMPYLSDPELWESVWTFLEQSPKN